MKIIAGVCFFALANSSLTLLEPMPAKSSTNSLPLTEKNGTFASPAHALASIVLPVPGGPARSAPLGTLAPIFLYLFGFCRKSTISLTSILAFPSPAISLKRTLGRVRISVCPNMLFLKMLPSLEVQRRRGKSRGRKILTPTVRKPFMVQSQVLSAMRIILVLIILPFSTSAMNFSVFSRLSVLIKQYTPSTQNLSMQRLGLVLFLKTWISSVLDWVRISSMPSREIYSAFSMLEQQRARDKARQAKKQGPFFLLLPLGSLKSLRISLPFSMIFSLIFLGSGMSSGDNLKRLIMILSLCRSKILLLAVTLFKHPIMFLSDDLLIYQIQFKFAHNYTTHKYILINFISSMLMRNILQARHLRILPSSRHSFSPFSPFYSFSSSSEKINSVLKSIKIEMENKPSNLLDSGVIASQHLDPDSKKLTIALNLTKDYMKIKNILKQNLESQGFSNVEIMLAPKKEGEKYARKGNLLNIGKVIAVSSCKGGVGKSTIAINVAANLQNQGFKVGIFDADIYGPSLPTLINKEGQTLQQAENNPKQIEPKIYEGLTCMSFGFVGTKPAAMRGPMVSSIVSQLLHQTQWGELDYLVIDMPPGTGDIQISLCQELKFDGAVIVTTPQRLAFMDVIKGIEMFQDLRVRILGVVENMAYYQCSKCGNKDEIFGKGFTKLIMEQFGIQNAFKLPLMSEISKYSDLGTPVAFVLPEGHTVKKTYNHICTSIQKELEKPAPKVNAYYDTNQRAIVIKEQGKSKKIDPYTLRLSCKCAGCIDELSGAMLIRKEKIDPEVYPTKMEEKGNYAVAVVWSDGHRSSIYPYKRLMSDEIVGL